MPPLFNFEPQPDISSVHSKPDGATDVFEAEAGEPHQRPERRGRLDAGGDFRRRFRDVT